MVVLIREEPGYVVGAFDNLLVAVTRKPPDGSGVRGYANEIRRLAAEYPDGIASIVVPRAPRPSLSPNVRNLISQTWMELDPLLSSSLLLIQARGFAAAIQRSLITTMLLAMGRAEKIKVSGDLKAASAWLAEREKRFAGRAQAIELAIDEFVRLYEP